MWFKFWVTLVGAINMFINPVRIHGKEKLKDGAAIICPNHTTLKDPVYIAVALGYTYKMAFMAKEELMRNPILRWIFTSINVFGVKRGSGDINAIKKSIGALKDGRKLVMFPEGTRVKDGEAVDIKAGAAMLAAKTSSPIIPVYIRNGNKLFKFVDVYIGDEIKVNITDKKLAAEGYKEAAARCMDEIHRMEQRYK